ncbi:MAG: hypothetical protein JRI61_07435, partial [Deltaproteobacteria bacterium]|nr:hypothetical protein [Deltaproteobacteria bacterium]
MEKKRKFMRQFRIFTIAVMIFVIPVFFFGFTGKPAQVHDEESQHLKPFEDVIYISAMESFGETEKPYVRFPHGIHADAVKKYNEDCNRCHKTTQGKTSFKFMRFEFQSKDKVSKDEMMDIYHNNCITCHEEIAEKNETSGPVTCGECHVEKQVYDAYWHSSGFDNSLHYRHIKATDNIPGSKLDNTCQQCHTHCKTGIYEKGKETSCRYCHMDKADKEKPSFKNAAHTSCINCHLKNLAEERNAGPVKCMGCHDPDEQKKIEKIFPVPRLDRNQPDMVIITTGNMEMDEAGKNRMNLVPFDHSIHEQKNTTCRVCHHADLNKCNKCHTLQGSKEGKNVTLEMAMHSDTSQASCIGCHDQQKKEKKCAGCHEFFHKGQQKGDESCNKCHRNDPPQTKDQTKHKIIYPDAYENLPETIEIKSLANKYEAARFPHRMIVEKIVSDIEGNRLVDYFHKNEGTLCRGCHHNSPESATPPKCSNCHGA